MKPIPTIPCYRCPDCDLTLPYHRWAKDAYVGVHCGQCGSEVHWEHDQPANYVSVALYETDRAYGGPEEGGWYYDCGTRCDETLKNFALPDEWPQAQLYLDRLRAEAAEQSSRYQRYQATFYVDEVAPSAFPRHTPRYS